jgi:hypothetical protein
MAIELADIFVLWLQDRYQSENVFVGIVRKFDLNIFLIYLTLKVIYI